MKFIHISKWEKTQHYKKRNPPWIRLYIDITQKYDHEGQPKKFYLMSDCSKLTFLMLLCISPKFNNNIPFESEAELRSILGLKRIDLKPLFLNGYVTASKVASKVASTSEQGMLAPETETDTDTDTEKHNGDIFLAKEFLKTKKVKTKFITEWLKIRKGKSLTNTETAFYAIFREIKKSGLPVNDVFQLCIERGWGGFRASWLNNLQGEITTTQPEPKKKENHLPKGKTCKDCGFFGNCQLRGWTLENEKVCSVGPDKFHEAENG